MRLKDCMVIKTGIGNAPCGVLYRNKAIVVAVNSQADPRWFGALTSWMSPRSSEDLTWDNWRWI